MPKKAAAAIAKIDEVKPAIDSETFNQMVGAAKYASFIHNQTKSDIVRFLTRVRDDKLFLDHGFASIEEFLDSSMSPMSHRTFYRELELFENEGEQYDLFNEWKIPARVRRQLTSGDIAIDGNEVVIGGERVAVGDGTVIKQVIERLVKEKIAAQKDATETAYKLDGEKIKNRIAGDDIERLGNEVTRLKAGTPYEQQLRETIHAMLSLTAKIGQLPDDEKASKGTIALPQLEAAIERISNAYGLELEFGGAK